MFKGRKFVKQFRAIFICGRYSIKWIPDKCPDEKIVIKNSPCFVFRDCVMSGSAVPGYGRQRSPGGFRDVNEKGIQIFVVDAHFFRKQ